MMATQSLFETFLDSACSVRTISPDDDYHYFFGYYDLNAYHKNGSYHLAHRVRFMNRLPEKNDICELGYINLKTREFTKFAETTAWNFQQGALLTYNMCDYDEVFYNVRTDTGFSTCIHNLKTGKKRYTEKACGCIAPNGKYGLAVNFSRIYDLRPGYGYAGRTDPWYNIKLPEDDGVFLVDLQTGKTELIISYARMLSEFPEIYLDEKFVINHITFNTASDRFLLLLRNFTSEKTPTRLTSLITSDLSGNMYARLSNAYISHYHWKNPHQILFVCEMHGKTAVHLLNDRNEAYTTYELPPGEADIHCLYSPDRRYMVGDGYPHEEPYRSLYFYNMKTGFSRLLMREYSIPPSNTDIRCDLHNRWNTAGDRISYDSTKNGKREICEIDVSALVQNKP